MVRGRTLLLIAAALAIPGCDDPAGPGPGPFSEGLVAYYPLNGDVTDLLASGAEAGVYGGAGGTDRFGDPAGAFQFDGFDDWVDTRVSFDFEPRTVSVWFRAGSLDGGYQRMFVQNDASLAYGAFGMGISEDGRLEGRAGGNAAFFPGPVSVEEGRWYHLVLIRSGPLESYYLDGALLDTSEATAGGSFGGRVELVLGATRIPDRFFDGRLDDLRIYERALSAEEVESLYAYEAAAN
jgi:Concanavalin A-like lectin/glucanases superfamily